MSDQLLLIIVFLLGAICGVIAAYWEQSARERKSAFNRQQYKEIRGIPDRDAAQPGAVGNALIRTAEYRERDTDHGMDM